ncbi:MAG TPA: hypothetical protein VKV05_11310 [Terriglobales bacterium]|nr:hypothetical protein [Terriglobales bacterium]
MAIDDKFDQIEQQFANADQSNTLDLVLRLSAAIPGIGALVAPFDAIQQYRTFEDFKQRVDAYIKALVETVRGLSGDVEKIRKGFEDEECWQAFVRGIFETAQALNTDRARIFGKIFGAELVAINPVWDEAAALIRDLNQLTESDIQTLRLLSQYQAQLIKVSKPFFDDYTYDQLLQTVPRLLQELDRLGHSRSEFYSRASRLSGFGLAIQLNWNQARLAPHEQGFAISVRGKRLIEMLDQ